MSKLVTYVSVFDDLGYVHSFGPNDSVPDWARGRITNPAVWDVAPAASAPKGSTDDPPPQGGPGSGRPAWAEYAGKHGVTVESDWNRDDIIAALEKAGVAV